MNSTIYHFKEEKWNVIASYWGTELSTKFESDSFSVIHEKVCQQIADFDNYLNDNDNIKPENYHIGNDFYIDDKHYEYIFLHIARSYQYTLYYVYCFDFVTLTGIIIVYASISHPCIDSETDLKVIQKSDIIDGIDHAVYKRTNPCSLGINFTALRKLRDGQYNVLL